MGWLLLLIVGGSIVLSGVVAGLARAMHNVTGVSFPLLFGDPAQKHDLGVIPVLLLKTGIFSVPFVWGTAFLRIDYWDEVTLLQFVSIGALLALIHIFLVKTLPRFPRITFEIFGILIGLMIGGLLGIVAISLIGLYPSSENIDAEVFLLVSMGIGCIVGGLNGKSLSNILTRIPYATIAAEIGMGGVVGGFLGFYALCFMSDRISIIGFDLLLFMLGLLVTGCLVGVCCILAQYVIVLPLRRGMSTLLGWLLQSLPAQRTRSTFFLKLLSVLLLAAATSGAAIYMAKGFQYICPFLIEQGQGWRDKLEWYGLWDIFFVKRH